MRHIVFHRFHPRAGLSLLEMILATAILMAGALTMAQLSFVTSRHSVRGQDEIIALEIAAYQFEQLSLGMVSVQETPLTPVIDPQQLSADQALSSTPSLHPWSDWQFALQVQSSSQPGMVQVQLDVVRLPPGAADGTALSGSIATDTAASSGDVASDAASDAASSTFLFQRSYVRLLPAPQRSQSSDQEASSFADPFSGESL